MEFDLETILTTSRYAAIIVPLLLVGAFSLAVYRAGSAFPILASLWQLTAGKRCNDPVDFCSGDNLDWRH